MAWAGKAFFHHLNDDHQQSGEIIEEVSPGLLLVRFDRFNADSEARYAAHEMVLIRVEDLIAKPSDDGYDHPWEFFEDRAALDKFYEFIDSLPEDEPEGEKPHLHQVN